MPSKEVVPGVSASTLRAAMARVETCRREAAHLAELAVAARAAGLSSAEFIRDRDRDVEAAANRLAKEWSRLFQLLDAWPVDEPRPETQEELIQADHVPVTRGRRGRKPLVDRG